MPSAERSVTINRPAAEVFAYLADGANGNQWRSGVLDVKKESGEGVGAIYRQGVRGPMRKRIAADYEITAHDPGKKLEFKAIAGPVRPKGGYKLSESSGRTKVTFWLKEDLGLLKRLVLGRSVQKSMDAEMNALDKLKQVLEGGASAGSTATPDGGTRTATSKAGTSKSAPAKTSAARTARRKPKAS
ncbi:MAG: SRPBCC family protein [Candidatus Limnocylindrales bacterium]